MYSIEDLQQLFGEEIAKQLEYLKKKDPAGLYGPVEYTLEMGGKRLRPVLLLLSYNLFSEDVSNALPAALAIEVFHNFTLLHDDIMDKAEMRRNRPVVHKKYGENSAILSGDAMAFLSYKYLMQCKSERLSDVISLFSETAVQVCEGQQYDMDFEIRLDVTEGEYLNMIKLKTAVLLACALKMGALLANQSDEIADRLYNWGLNLGWAFQLQDDFLDSFGDQETFGKKIGGDIIANKKTYLLIKALEISSPKQKKELLCWMEKKDYRQEEKIEAVKEIYMQEEIIPLTLEKIDYFYSKSEEVFSQIPLTDVVKQQLNRIAQKMLKRKH